MDGEWLREATDQREESTPANWVSAFRHGEAKHVATAKQHDAESVPASTGFQELHDIGNSPTSPIAAICRWYPPVGASACATPA